MLKRRKIIISICMLFLLTIFSNQVEANESIDISADYNSEVVAALDEKGTLHIQGSGQMKSWDYSTSDTWHGFFKLSEIKKVIIGNGITNIGRCAFKNCYNLVSVNMGNTIKNIKENAFEDCTNLQKIELSDSLEKIESRAFEGCDELKEININKNLKTIANDAFYYCINLMSINVDSSNNYFISQDGILFSKDKKEILIYPISKEETEYEIPNEVTKIGAYCFSYCETLEKIMIPETIIEIGQYAFENCTSLKNIKLQQNLQVIENGTFFNCTNLEEVEMPDSILKIKSYAFAFCEKLQKANIPDTVKSIGKGSFSYCIGLKNLNIPENITEIGEDAFEESSIAIVVGKQKSDETSYILPDILNHAMDSKHILYTSEEFELENCYIDNGKVIFEEDLKETTIKVKSGKLNGLKVMLIKSGTIKYSINETTFDSVTAELLIADYEKVQNNDGNLTYTFKKNGTFEFEYEGLNKIKHTAIAKVTWVRLYGDINANGKIDINDRLKIERHIAATRDESILNKHPDWILTEENFKAADVNKDGEIDINDKLKIERNIVAEKIQNIAEKYIDWIIKR